MKPAFPAALVAALFPWLWLSGCWMETALAYTWTADAPPGNFSIEYQLKQYLMRGYDVTSRPVRADKTAVTCGLGISLFHILDTHWVDEYLRWNTSTYPIEKFWIPSRSIWRPDLIIANYANDEYSDYINTNAIVYSDGKVMWTFPIVVKMYCTLDVRYFPFDTQACNVTLMSWTYDGFRLRLNHTGPDDQKVYFIERNQEWMVSSITPYLEEKIYPCCPEPFPLVHFSIHMYRRCLFYVINLICPCLLIYCVSILGFFLPIESGEKVNLEITVLLALVVFLLMVSEAMPPTPDAVPVVGLLFSVTMLMVAVAVVMAVTVTRFYFSEAQRRPPRYAMRLARLHRKWGGRNRRVPQRLGSLRSQRGIARMRRVEVDAASLGSAEDDAAALAGTPQMQFAQRRQYAPPLQQQVPPSASYFKGALAAAAAAATAGNGGLEPLQRQSLQGSFHRGLQEPQFQPLPQQQQQQHQHQQQQLPEPEDFTEEWHAAAFALDRIFFWIFISLTCAMFLTVSWVTYPAFHVEHPPKK